MRLYEVVNTPNLARARQMGFDTNTIYYHGTPDVRPIRDVGFGDPYAEHRSSPRPFFFSSDKRIADSYADDHRAWDYQGAEAETVPVFLKMRNSKRLDWGGRTFRGRDHNGEGYALDDEIDQARKDGHDSVIISNIDDTYGASGEPKGKPGNVTVVFDSEQILIINNITEGHHAYDDPDYDTEFQPIKSGDTFRVFHGLNSFDNALAIAKNGVSGRDRALRIYSYESNNNPFGVYVTLSFKIALEFVGALRDQVIMEFNTSLDELEAPVWPGGGYTVQGEYAEYFSGDLRQNRRDRKKRRGEAEKETEEWLSQQRGGPDAVRASDQKYLANMLLNSREHQALFVGDLDPQSIVAFHVRKNTYPGKDPRFTYDGFGKSDWISMSPQQFLEAYKDVDEKAKDDTRMFSPEDRFDPRVFMQRLQERFGGALSDDNVKSGMQHLKDEILRSDDRASSFVLRFEGYLWPRQYRDAFRWLMRTDLNK